MAMTKEEQEKMQQLEEENAKLKAEQEKKNTGVNLPLILPDPSITPTIPYVETEKIKVKLYKDQYRNKNDKWVCINGRNMQIKRGKEVEIPKYFADFLAQQEEEEQAIWEKVEQEEEQYKQDTAKLG